LEQQESLKLTRSWLYSANQIEQWGGLCNSLYLSEWRNHEALDTIDINGENTIIRFESTAAKNELVIPERRFEKEVGTWVLKEEKM
jgi:hypothetical protein